MTSYNTTNEFQYAFKKNAIFENRNDISGRKVIYREKKKAYII